jgi:hypothetical protein
LIAVFFTPILYQSKVWVGDGYCLFQIFLLSKMF